MDGADESLVVGFPSNASSPLVVSRGMFKYEVEATSH